MMAKQIVCWVRAESVEDAQSAAYDVDFVSDWPEEAPVFPEDSRSPELAKLYRVEINAKLWAPKRKAKSSKKGAKRT
jgi:hypothetical protein